MSLDRLSCLRACGRSSSRTPLARLDGTLDHNDMPDQLFAPRLPPRLHVSALVALLPGDQRQARWVRQVECVRIGRVARHTDPDSVNR
jgi:hypothetical protein